MPDDPVGPGMQDAPETTRAQYEPAEAEAIRAAFVATGAAECPRCRAPMLRRAIGGGSFGLGYARRREWMLCPRCRRSAIFDAARGTRT